MAPGNASKVEPSQFIWGLVCKLRILYIPNSDTLGIILCRIKYKLFEKKKLFISKVRWEATEKFQIGKQKYDLIFICKPITVAARYREGWK